MIFWNTRNVNLIRKNLFSSFIDTLMNTRKQSKQKRSQDSTFKQLLFQFRKLISDNFLFSNKTQLPKCLVIYLDLILCFFLDLCNGNKINISSNSSAQL